MMFSILLLLLPLLVSAYSNPGVCSGACNTHDPALIQRTSDGTWFLFSTGGGIGVASASSIDGSFTAIGDVLADGSSIDLTGNTDLWVSFPCSRRSLSNKFERRLQTYITLAAHITFTMPFQLLAAKLQPLESQPPAH